MTEFHAGQFDIAVIGAGHAGIEAALKAGMRSVGVGDPCPLREATVVTGSLDGFTVDDLRWLIREQNRKCV